MGNKFAKNEPSRDVEALAQETDLSNAFVTRLSERFDVLDKQKKGNKTPSNPRMVLIFLKLSNNVFSGLISNPPVCKII